MSDIKSTVLYGAIIGDISGSPYEGDSRAIKTKDYKFIRHSGHFTDDTVFISAHQDQKVFVYAFFKVVDDVNYLHNIPL